MIGAARIHPGHHRPHIAPRSRLLPTWLPAGQAEAEAAGLQKQQAAAAAKIQAIHRGNLGRKEADNLAELQRQKQAAEKKRAEEAEAAEREAAEAKAAKEAAEAARLQAEKEREEAVAAAAEAR